MARRQQTRGDQRDHERRLERMERQDFERRLARMAPKWNDTATKEDGLTAGPKNAS